MRVLGTGLVACALLGGCSDSPSPERGTSRNGADGTNSVATDRPNVLLIVIDTLRADRLGCYGYHKNTSPNIDELARRSYVFDQSLSNSDGTLLTHVSLFTSRHTRPAETGPGESTTLAEVFAGAGYRTYGITANPALTPVLGWAKGFDWYTDKPIDDATLHQMLSEKSYSKKIEVRSAEQTSDFVLDRLRRHARETGDQPWFLFVNYVDPHDPYTERKPWSDEFRESASDISGTLRRNRPITIWEWVGRSLPTLSSDDLARLGELYDAEIRYADSHIRRVFDYLAETGEDRNTIVVVTSDHGEVLGEHGMFTHMLAAYDAELKVPLIVSVPWLNGEEIRSSDLVESIDVAPTLLSLCGIDIPGAFVGVPLIGRDGKLRPTGRSHTIHTHHAVNVEQRERYGFPPEAALDSIVLRLRDRKVYRTADGQYLVFDISEYPKRRAIEATDEDVALMSQLDPTSSTDDSSEMPEDVIEQMKALGYFSDTDSDQSNTSDD